jgi:hypothetical protein
MEGLMAAEQFAITILIESRRRELGLSRAEFVAQAGYRNTAKGMRRLDSLLAGDLETTDGLIQGLPADLNLPKAVVNHAIEETRRKITWIKQQAAEKEEAAWRAAFKPHAIILTEQTRPQPLFVAALIGVENLLRLDFDSSGKGWLSEEGRART